MATRSCFQHIYRGISVVFMTTALFSCEVNNKITETRPAVWRASVSNGDKPGVGYEILEGNGKISGSFLLFEPGQPHNFSTAMRIPMTIVKLSENEYHARVQTQKGQTDELSIRFAGQPDTTPRKAVIQQLDQPSDPQDYEFVRVR